MFRMGATKIAKEVSNETRGMGGCSRSAYFSRPFWYVTSLLLPPPLLSISLSPSLLPVLLASSLLSSSPLVSSPLALLVSDDRPGALSEQFVLPARRFPNCHQKPGLNQRVHLMPRLMQVKARVAARQLLLLDSI